MSDSSPWSTTIDRALRGDADAFENLVAQHRQRTWEVCRRITGDPEAADEALAETYALAWRRLRTFRSRRPFPEWLDRLATRAAWRVVRRRSEHARHAGDVLH